MAARLLLRVYKEIKTNLLRFAFVQICDFGLARIVSEAQMSGGGKQQPDTTDRGIKPTINNFGIPPVCD